MFREGLSEFITKSRNTSKYNLKGEAVNTGSPYKIQPRYSGMRKAFLNSASPDNTNVKILKVRESVK